MRFVLLEFCCFLERKKMRKKIKKIQIFIWFSQKKVLTLQPEIEIYSEQVLTKIEV